MRSRGGPFEERSKRPCWVPGLPHVVQPAAGDLAYTTKGSLSPLLQHHPVPISPTALLLDHFNILVRMAGVEALTFLLASTMHVG